ncbi:MAG: flagellar basal body rod C-terminal domain-containing protein [Thiovulaceae bacterium]|nr:flagellar basal body rod C-terminal domain-containing protein [Sulfurimonadaceae bacterium]
MISSNVSSIQANQVFLNNNANNIANVNTDGFIPSDTYLSNNANGNVSADTRLATDNGSQTSQTDLTKEITDQITISRSVEANVNTIKTQDEMFGSLLDIKV